MINQDAAAADRTKSADTTKSRNDRSFGQELSFDRIFSTKGVHPFDDIEWELRTASITDEKGETIFRQDNVEIPASWSQLATNIVASKYFYGENNTPEREHSVKQLVHRVTRTIADWGLEDGYFADKETADLFYEELTWLCLNQYGSFNSPVWFNCGLWHMYQTGEDSCKGTFYFDRTSEAIERAPSQYQYPQCSACFIQSVSDNLDSIMDLAGAEAMLFKFGSGTGSDLSTIRSCREKLSGGGIPSGPLSFLQIYDRIAGVVKSGGKTRRAAKMNTLKDWHPDIKEFIQAKQDEERKAQALIEQGYSADFNGEAYASISFQNENLSVRLSDRFLEAAEKDEDWTTHWVTDETREGPTYKARQILRWIAEGTWSCGDPGVQYEDTINHWHTSKNTGPINSSNPCSEYMFLDDSACNLASLNLMKFLKEDLTFDVERFKAAVKVFITAQEIIVDNASYPTDKIALNSHRYRPLGLGYANLGALIMSLGHAYDSAEGRSLASGVTAIMHLHAYSCSADMAERHGPFEGYDHNREPMLDVIRNHNEAIEEIHEGCPTYLRDAARECGKNALAKGEQFGFRNAQVTVLAPTGTIGFMMDCDTTGVEPDIALVKYKMLAGKGLLKIVNQSVPLALRRLGYGEDAIKAITAHIDENDTIEGAPQLKDEHLPIFDCAFKPRNGKRFISYRGHLRMMAAVQPFLSGAISKTINMPREATVEDIMEAYLEGWKLGLKAVAIYRDGCKGSQPVSTSRDGDKSDDPTDEFLPNRRRLPDTRSSLTHKFSIAGHEGYITVGLYEDGSPGEMFITMAKEGSTIGGLMDCFGTAISVCLQHGVPLETLVRKFAHTRFEPSGFTQNPDIPMAKSPMDYMFRWLEKNFLEKPPAELAEAAAPKPKTETPATPKQQASGATKVDDQFSHFMDDAPSCDNCGAITVRNGACYRCYNCGNSMGCS